MRPSIPVLFRDADLLVVDKPAGMLSVPDRYDPDRPVLAEELRAAEGELFVVHRLDADTSGVLLFARNAETHKQLSLAFEGRAVTKTYRALVRGVPAWEESACDYPLRPDGDKLHRTIIDGGHGKPSMTRFKVLAKYGPYSLIEALPETGRTHQIRVHLAALGFPIVADPFYGDGRPLYLSGFKRKWRGNEATERPLVSRTALHALSIELVHPRSGEALRFEAPYPKDLKAAINQLEKR